MLAQIILPQPPVWLWLQVQASLLMRVHLCRGFVPDVKCPQWESVWCIRLGQKSKNEIYLGGWVLDWPASGVCMMFWVQSVNTLIDGLRLSMVCVCVRARACLYIWVDQLVRIGSLIYRVTLGDCTQVLRLGSKCLYLLSYLTCPEASWNKELSSETSLTLSREDSMGT